MSDDTPAPAGVDHFDQLFTALAKAQSEFKVAVFDKKAVYGPYASFKSVREASIDALTKNGLSIIQPVTFDGQFYVLTTQLNHSSGQFARASIRLMIDRQNMQGLGSAITYAKRYAWAAMIGVVSDDDDDATTGDQTGKPLPVDKPPRNSPPAQKTQSKKESNAHAIASRDAIDQINGLCIDRQVSEADLHYLIKAYGFTTQNVPVWVAREIYKLLSDPDTNQIKILAHAQRLMSETEAKRILGGQK